MDTLYLHILLFVREVQLLDNDLDIGVSGKFEEGLEPDQCLAVLVHDGHHSPAVLHYQVSEGQGDGLGVRAQVQRIFLKSVNTHLIW